jgi:hypothetical protein
MASSKFKQTIVQLEEQGRIIRAAVHVMDARCLSEAAVEQPDVSSGRMVRISMLAPERDSDEAPRAD